MNAHGESHVETMGRILPLLMAKVVKSIATWNVRALYETLAS